jgi:hypothetical protein
MIHRIPFIRQSKRKFQSIIFLLESYLELKYLNFLRISGFGFRIYNSSLYE